MHKLLGDDASNDLDATLLQRVKQHIILNFNAYKEIKMMASLNLGFHTPKKVKITNFGKITFDALDSTKKTVVFDLDETLVHVNRGKAYNQSQYFVPVTKQDGVEVNVGFNIRPYCQEMLRSLKDKYNIVVMTASVGVYAEKVVKMIDPKMELIQLLISKESCKQYPGGKTIKDLLIFWDLFEKKAQDKEENPPLPKSNSEAPGSSTSLGRFRFEDILLVDNLASAYADQPENGIPILPYYGVTTQDDQELQLLTSFLLRISDQKDVREALRKNFMTELMEKSKDIHEYLGLVRSWMKI